MLKKDAIYLTDTEAGFPWLHQCRFAASCFLAETVEETGVVRLTKASDPSDYARCFHVFLAHTLKQPQPLPSARLAVDIREAVRKQRQQRSDSFRQKPFRQLLTFSLSALKVLGRLREDPLEDLVEEQLLDYSNDKLKQLGCLDGRAGSGNQAMFMAIFLIHARDYLGMDTQPLLDEWGEAHIKRMNRFGFWGADAGMTHLQFQNGYHQHEILEYLKVENPWVENTLAALRGLADAEGHFAPYPGGGGCYDYDAVFMLTPQGHVPDEATRALLLLTAATVASEQQPDGGFAESVRVRPRSIANIRRFASYTLDALGKGPLFTERLRYGLTLQRPKHDRIHTHWSQYSRRWDESDLWDSWFRMLTLARIDVAMHPEHASHWGFIDYPGIGYHPSLRTNNPAL